MTFNGGRGKPECGGFRNEEVKHLESRDCSFEKLETEEKEVSFSVSVCVPFLGFFFGVCVPVSVHMCVNWHGPLLISMFLSMFSTLFSEGKEPAEKKRFIV